VGDISNIETHEKRSSSMTFALRWMRENLRYILPVAFVSCVMALVFMVLIYGTTIKNVTVVIDGQESVVQTNQSDLKRLLDEQAIAIGEHDLVSLPMDTKLKDGQRIVIDRAIPVTLRVDGDSKTVYTTAKTVENALQDLQVSLGVYDRTEPSLTSAIAPNEEVRVIRVTKMTKTESSAIPYETTTTNDTKLAKGKQTVKQQGQEGVLVKQYEQVFEDGVLVSQALVDETVQTPSVNKIVAVGTKKEEKVVALSVDKAEAQVVKKGEITFSYKEILNNVQLTAYTAAEGGKKKSDPYYGMTASGTKATEGRTIAVDPSIVPMGWWVYIEGIGYRRAEDTGSAVKGKIIDVYYDSQEYVNKFGRKRGFTVYVIGPKKPSVD